MVSLQTTTNMALNPLDHSRLVIKSMYRCQQAAFRIGRGGRILNGAWQEVPKYKQV